jgi:hypothetical protein
MRRFSAAINVTAGQSAAVDWGGRGRAADRRATQAVASWFDYVAALHHEGDRLAGDIRKRISRDSDQIAVTADHQ